MYDLTAAEATQTYADHLSRLIAKLTEGFGEAGAVNLVTAHLTVVGASQGGGEREAHTVLGYAVPATVFPTSAHYVALGHLHRAQTVLGPCPVRYSGSPLAIDFGEAENVPAVTIVDVTAQTAAKVREVPVTAATRAAHGARHAGSNWRRSKTGEAWLRVYRARDAPGRAARGGAGAAAPGAGGADRPGHAAATAPGPRAEERAGRSPRDLFADYLDQPRRCRRRRTWTCSTSSTRRCAA